MWGQDWSNLIDLFVPVEDLIDLDERLRNKNWTVHDMVSIASKIYISLILLIFYLLDDTSRRCIHFVRFTTDD